MAKICHIVFNQWFTLPRNITFGFGTFPRFDQNFPKNLFDHFANYQILTFSHGNFIFTEGIKQPYPAFNPYTKGRYPGGEIVRQGGPKWGIWG